MEPSILICLITKQFFCRTSYLKLTDLKLTDYKTTLGSTSVKPSILNWLITVQSFCGTGCLDNKLFVCLIVLCLCRDVNKKLLDDKDEAEAIEARRVQMLTSFHKKMFFLIQEHLKIPLCVWLLYPCSCAQEHCVWCWLWLLHHTALWLQRSYSRHGRST